SLMDMRFAVICQLARHPMPLSGSCSSARAFAPRFFQTLRRRIALALRYPSPPSGWDEDSHPASRKTFSAHKKKQPPSPKAASHHTSLTARALHHRTPAPERSPKLALRKMRSSSSSCSFDQVANDLQYVMVLNRFDLVGERDELPVNRVQLASRQVKSERLALAAERVSAGMLSKHQPVLRHSDRLRGH